MWSFTRSFTVYHHNSTAEVEFGIQLCRILNLFAVKVADFGWFRDNKDIGPRTRCWQKLGARFVLSERETMLPARSSQFSSWVVQDSIILTIASFWSALPKALTGMRRWNQKISDNGNLLSITATLAWSPIILTCRALGLGMLRQILGNSVQRIPITFDHQCDSSQDSVGQSSSKEELSDVHFEISCWGQWKPRYWFRSVTILITCLFLITCPVERHGNFYATHRDVKLTVFPLSLVLQLHRLEV